MVLGNLHENMSKEIAILNGMISRRHRFILEPKSVRHLLWGYESEILSACRRGMKDLMGKWKKMNVFFIVFIFS